MPASGRRVTRRLPERQDLDRGLHDAYVVGGVAAAQSLGEARLGWTPTRSQVLIAVGRYAWAIGERRGDQAYQLRAERDGRRMPRQYYLSAPSARGRRFGIEVEFMRGSGTRGQQQRIVDRLNAAGVPARIENYGHAVPTMWKMTTDATVTGGELVSPPISGDRAHFEVREALRAVKAEGGVASASQGMHVHHDVSDYDAADLLRLMANLRWAEEALLGYVPRSRYEGGSPFAARRMSASTWDHLRAEIVRGALRPSNNRGARGHYNRYVAWNWNAVIVQGSLEWRLLGHTLNTVKVQTWVEVGQAIHAYSKGGGEFGATVDAAAMTAALVAAGHLSQRAAERYVEQVDRRSGATRRAA